MLLQAMVLQQDALADLASCFGLKLNLAAEYTHCSIVRQRRIWAAGHPSKSHHPHNPKDKYLSSIPRTRTFRDSFDLLSADSSGSVRQPILPGDLCAGQIMEARLVSKRIFESIKTHKSGWLRTNSVKEE